MGGGEVHSHTSKKKKKKKNFPLPLHPRTPARHGGRRAHTPRRQGRHRRCLLRARGVTDRTHLAPPPPGRRIRLWLRPRPLRPAGVLFFFHSRSPLSVHPRPRGCSPLPSRHPGWGGGPKCGGAAVLAGAGADECVGAPAFCAFLVGAVAGAGARGRVGAREKVVGGWDGGSISQPPHALSLPLFSLFWSTPCRHGHAQA